MLQISDKRVASWTALLAIGTVALVIIAMVGAYFGYKQISEIRKNSNADFIIKFRESFYKSNTSYLEELIGDNLLVYDSTNDIDYFKMNNVKLDSMKLDSDNFKITKKLLKKENLDTLEGFLCTVSFIDENLLGYFEEIGYFEKEDIIKIDYIYQIFSDDIETCWDNPEIRKYIQHIRSQKKENADFYENFEAIYNKLKDYEKEKFKI